MTPEEHIEACTRARLAKLVREADEARRVMRRAYDAAHEALKRRRDALRAELGRKPPVIPEETHRLLMNLAAGERAVVQGAGTWREKTLRAFLELATQLALPEQPYVDLRRKPVKPRRPAPRVARPVAIARKRRTA